jgi:hypothetical protein
MLDTARAQTLIFGLLEARQIACKAVWVGRSGTLLLTFHSRSMAELGALALADFATGLKIGSGSDDGPRQGNGRRARHPVWRIAGRMDA